MNVLYPLLAVAALVLVAYVGVGVAQMSFLFGIVLPHLAIAVFVGGFIYRVLRWASAPVPFHIPTACGQQKSLPWIRANRLESPSGTLGVVGRLAMEVLVFRSLFRNAKSVVRDRRVIFVGEQLLWVAALAFHYSLLIIFLRHYRFFTEPVPFFVTGLLNLDGFFQVGVPPVYLTTLLVLVAGAYLLLRRLAIPQVRYISLPADYFALFLLLGIALSGALMRHLYRVDVAAVKELAIGLVSFHPVSPQGIGPLFYVHLFLVCTLLAYFPFSKLMHLGGILLSPTRNLANNSRSRRHPNPWNYPVNVHTYAEWQEEFRDKLASAGLPLDEVVEEPHIALASGVKHG